MQLGVGHGLLLFSREQDGKVSESGRVASVALRGLNGGFRNGDAESGLLFADGHVAGDQSAQLHMVHRFRFQAAPARLARAAITLG